MTVDLRVYEPAECGPDGYPYAWHSGEPAIKDHIRETAGNRCQRCGHPYAKGDGQWSACDHQCTHEGPYRWKRPAEENWHEGALLAPQAMHLHQINGSLVEAEWRILTVHHLNQVKADCRWWNLTSLCQRCHLRVQRVVLMERVWPWPHSDWFKPHAAGWYAHAYLGLDLTRDETLARLDELLDLERVA